MPPMWMGFGVQNSLNKGLLLVRFPLNMGWFSRSWSKVVKMGSFPRKFIIKVGAIASVGN